MTSPHNTISQQPGKPRLLNVGCGAVAHPDWINIDLSSASPSVIAHDIRKGLPFETASVDACYSSHVVEHLTPVEASNLLRECHRVLKQGGVIRVVVPDLEGAAKGYLDALEQVRQGATSAEARYRWITIELLDQLVREKGGGDMAPFLRSVPPEDRPLIRERVGLQAESFWQPETARTRGFFERLTDKGVGGISRTFRQSVAKACAALLLGRDGARAMEIGLFRSSGEAHKWMYDHHSMGKLLRESGFVDVTACRADESRIPDFNRFELDVENGLTRKTNSLFIEARKD